jgi:tetratricopeptide (TPR) repeat protein
MVRSKTRQLAVQQSWSIRAATLLYIASAVQSFTITETKCIHQERRPSSNYCLQINNGRSSLRTERNVLQEPSTVSRVAAKRNPSFEKSKSQKQEDLMIQKSLTREATISSIQLSGSAGNYEKQQLIREVARKSYNRKRIPESEQEIKKLRKQRQAEYDRITKNTIGPVSLWSFESLFPRPVWDEQSIKKDLYGIRERDEKRIADRKNRSNSTESEVGKTSLAFDDRGQSPVVMNTMKTPNAVFPLAKLRSSWYGGAAMMRLWREPRMRSGILSYSTKSLNGNEIQAETDTIISDLPESDYLNLIRKTVISSDSLRNNSKPILKIDRDLTRMVEDRVYGYRRLQTGELRYETSLMSDGAVAFRDGIRLGNPLKINSDRLNYLAKKEMQQHRIEEASELYEQAITIDPRDGRAYLGLSRCAERRRDFILARKWLQIGVTNSVSLSGDQPDRGANPYLLQAMGCLEEKMGNLAAAESLYVLAAKSRPSHAAAWVSLAQLRTRKLGQPASAGRICFQTAERELSQAGLAPSSYIYTAWAALERKAGDIRQSRKLFKKAIEVDPKCSAAWLQLGVMEADSEEWEEAENCFKTVLKFDQRNSKVLQAYALMETKRPNGDSRYALELFERALKANPRDAAILQAYGLYVSELGDVKSARNLLKRGTEVNKRHSPAWQAWGVFEMRQGNIEEARKIFQEGIWACGQLTGSQSGGYECARLWQAWGVLESDNKDFAAARRCFSRAIDANSRNVPAVTAWALMEERVGNVKDARMIFERALGNFAAGSNEKTSLWRTYELMEQRVGDVEAAKNVYQRSMREAMTTKEENKNPVESIPGGSTQKDAAPELIEFLTKDTASKKSRSEFEVVRWETPDGEVWMKNNAIESKIKMKNRRKR